MFNRHQFAWEVRTINVETGGSGPTETVKAYWSPSAERVESAVADCGRVQATRRTGRTHDAVAVTLIG